MENYEALQDQKEKLKELLEEFEIKFHNREVDLFKAWQWKSAFRTIKQSSNDVLWSYAWEFAMQLIKINNIDVSNYEADFESDLVRMIYVFLKDFRNTNGNYPLDYVALRVDELIDPNGQMFFKY